MASAKTSWITDFPQLCSHHDFLKVVHDCCQQFSLMSILLWSGSLRVIMFATLVNIQEQFLPIHEQLMNFLKRNKRFLRRMQKAICSSCKGSCLGIRFILCSIPSFWTDEHISQKCLTLNFHAKMKWNSFWRENSNIFSLLASLAFVGKWDFLSNFPTLWNALLQGHEKNTKWGFMLAKNLFMECRGWETGGVFHADLKNKLTHH